MTKRQAHQDRNQGGQPLPLRDISDGGSGCAADALSGNPCPNPAVVFFGNTCEAGMMCGTVENRFLEWRATVAVCQNSRKRWLLGVSVQLFGRFLRDNSLGRPENCCNLDEILILWGFKCVRVF